MPWHRAAQREQPILHVPNERLADPQAQLTARHEPPLHATTAPTALDQVNGLTQHCGSLLKTTLADKRNSEITETGRLRLLLAYAKIG